MDKGPAVSMWSRCCWDYCGEMSLQPLHGQLVPEASLSLELMGAFSSKDLMGPVEGGCWEKVPDFNPPWLAVQGLQDQTGAGCCLGPFHHGDKEWDCGEGTGTTSCCVSKTALT